MHMQPDPEEPPEIFDLPEQYCARVHMQHPEYPWFADLGLQWYAVPAVCAMVSQCGRGCAAALARALASHQSACLHACNGGCSSTRCPRLDHREWQ